MVKKAYKQCKNTYFLMIRIFKKYVLKNIVYDLFKQKYESFAYLVSRIEIRFSFSFKCTLNDAF